MHRSVVAGTVSAVVFVLGALGAGCAKRVDTGAAKAPVVAAGDEGAAEEGMLDPYEVRRITRSGRVQPPPPPPDQLNPPVTNPERAFLWRRLAWLDEKGQLAPGAYARALEQREANIAAWQQAGRDAGIAPDRWTARGPTNVGGRTRSLLVHPTQPQRMWAGSVSGGIWYSSNGGASWAPVDDRLQNLAIGCLAFDPQNPNVMYAGTGEGYFNGDAIRGLGIYKSVDGGATWNLIPSTAGWENTCRIAVQPGNSQVILASRRYGGIYRSTNGGQTWTQVLAAQGSFQVIFNPQNPQRAVAHVIDYSNGWYHKAVYSNDGGATWHTAGGLNQLWDFNSRIELALAPSNPMIVYASTGEGAGTIWRSTDGGVTYVRRTLEGQGSGAGWYYNAIWVDPTNPEFILVGGYRVFKSVDGGQTLTVISDGYILTSTPHPDIHGFVHDPGFNGTTNRRVYVLTDGGVHRTDNIYTASNNSGWVSLQPTYVASQFYGAAGDGPTGRIIGGTQDNGTLRVTTSSSTAVLTFGGDGGFCAIDPSNPNYTYGEYVALQLHRSTNGGMSANYIYQGISEAGTGTPNFIAPFVLDPNQPTRLLGGGVRLWRTNNARATPVSWTAISPGWGTTPISAIAVAPGNSNVVWVGLNDGRIMRTTNATAASPTWTAVDDNAGTNPLPNRYVTRILLDAPDGSVAYVCLGGFSPDNVYKTVNGGATWTDITGSGPTGLPDAPVRGIARHPADPQRLYVGTEVGVFATANGGQTWSTTNQGPANVSVDELVFMHGSTTLLAATHGRGLWTADVLTCTADWDHQGGVNSADIAAFLTSWLASVTDGTLEADFDGDMTVNSTDISAFLTAWLAQVGAGC